jgi:hypothetical protein
MTLREIYKGIISESRCSDRLPGRTHCCGLHKPSTTPCPPIGEDAAPEVSARELIKSRLAILSERIREGGGDPDGRAVRDAQAAWADEQERITSDSVIATVQGVRATITHVGQAEARAVLDDLQRQASAHPEGVPGHAVAHARLQFDELMRRNIQ